MFKYYYHVVLINENGCVVKYIDTIPAYDEKSAEDQCYNKFGCACNTGWERENFKAVKC
jgi:hypothetical protein